HRRDADAAARGRGGGVAPGHHRRRAQAGGVSMAQELPIYGLLAEFESPTDLVRAARAAYEAGYRRMDAYTPFPVEGLAETLGFRNTHVPLIVLLGGLVGCVGGFGMQYY